MNQERTQNENVDADDPNTTTIRSLQMGRDLIGEALAILGDGHAAGPDPRNVIDLALQFTMRGRSLMGAGDTQGASIAGKAPMDHTDALGGSVSPRKPRAVRKRAPKVTEDPVPAPAVKRKRGGRSLSPEENGRILAAIKAGKSDREIASELQHSTGTIWQIRKLWKTRRPISRPEEVASTRTPPEDTDAQEATPEGGEGSRGPSHLDAFQMIHDQVAGILSAHRQKHSRAKAIGPRVEVFGANGGRGLDIKGWKNMPAEQIRELGLELDNVLNPLRGSGRVRFS